MVRRRPLGWGILIVSWSMAGCARTAAEAADSTISLAVAEEEPMIPIQTYEARLSGVRSHNPDVKLSVGNDPELGEEPVLFVTYPAPTDDPAGRDVWCDAESQDWSGGRAISFSVKPEHAIKLSVSFFDRNRVVYTKWTVLQAAVWQSVRIPFDEIRPNPYFQPPDAQSGAPIDVGEVKGIAFAPNDSKPGRLSISKFVVSN
jgi:hypothetical protein